MPRLEWGIAGQRFYETGVDQGVLYVGSSPGVPWMGLLSVSENPSGGDPRPFYIDGMKYLNLSSAEEYEASITAFSAPPEFAPCDGAVPIQNGLYATQQPRVPFGFSYRTMIGNDVDGTDFGLKLHVVYNALAAPPQRSSSTIDNSVDPLRLTWSIATMAPAITGYRPTAHMVVDSRYADGIALSALEDILYGDDSHTARLPLPDEIIALFSP